MREADVGSILGFGFAPFTGGTLSYIDFMGTKNFVELCRKLEAKYGSRFTPPKLLIEMAAKGETFYGRFPPKKLAEKAARACLVIPRCRAHIAISRFGRTETQAPHASHRPGMTDRIKGRIIDPALRFDRYPRNLTPPPSSGLP